MAARSLADGFRESRLVLDQPLASATEMHSPVPTRVSSSGPVLLESSRRCSARKPPSLVDTVYQHVLAWQEALEAEGMKLSVWRIHRKIGMSGGLLTNMLLRETGLEIDSDRVERLQRLHAGAYSRRAANIQPLPGARELLAYLTQAKIPWAIATSGRMETARPGLEALAVDLGNIFRSNRREELPIDVRHPNLPLPAARPKKK